MGRDTVSTRVELDRESDAALNKWARMEDRSKRLQAKRIVRRVVQLWREEPEALKTIGLAN